MSGKTDWRGILLGILQLKKYITLSLKGQSVRYRTPKLYGLYFVSGGKDNYGVCDDNWIESICSRKTFIGIWQRHLTQRRGHSYKSYFNLRRLENYRSLFQRAKPWMSGAEKRDFFEVICQIITFLCYFGVLWYVYLWRIFQQFFWQIFWPIIF